MFPEEQKSLNITKEEIRNTMISNVRKARDYLCEKNPAIAADKLNVKFSVIIEKPSKEDRLPMTILIAPMSKPHNPPIVCVSRDSPQRGGEGQQVGDVGTAARPSHIASVISTTRRVARVWRTFFSARTIACTRAVRATSSR